MQETDLDQAKERLPELIEQAIGGEDVVITRGDQPLVRLTAVTTQKQQRLFGSAKGLIRISEDFDEPLEDFREYM